MRNKTLFFIFVIFFSFNLCASEVKSSWICTHRNNDFIRKVNVVHKSVGCDVYYIKPTETNDHNGEIIFHAEYSTSFCDKKGRDFVENKLVIEWGWRCDPVPKSSL